MMIYLFVTFIYLILWLQKDKVIVTGRTSLCVCHMSVTMYYVPGKLHKDLLKLKSSHISDYDTKNSQ